MAPFDAPREILKARSRLRRHVRRTPLEPSPALSERGDACVFLKLEALQHTGSFKFRGALNRLLALAPRTREHGVVAASSGNHGLAVAAACRVVGAPGTVFLPRNASRTKVRALARYGVEVRFHGKDCLPAERHARAVAAATGRPYISPYNDLQVVAGQGTVAVELHEQMGHVDTVLASVGGGGLISGLAGYLKSLQPHPEVIGCLPRSSPHMARSVRAGRILNLPVRPTLSDGTAGGIEEGAVTFDLCRRLVDDWLLVSESEIARAIRLILAEHHLVIEGAAGVAVAAYLRHHRRFAGRRVAIVLCGSNIALETLKKVLMG